MKGARGKDDQYRDKKCFNIHKNSFLRFKLAF